MAYFPKIKKIRYEGPDSKNPLAFKWYNEDEIVEGKTMKDHLRFSVVYWHTFRNALSDPFGVGTALRPWDDGTESVKNAQKRVKVAFEFMEKLRTEHVVGVTNSTKGEDRPISTKKGILLNRA